MTGYKNIITLSKNDRGIWDLDPSKGCASGLKDNPKGCYGDCYAARSAKIYGKDFSTTVLRYFKSRKHERQTIAKINKIDMPFVRMGCSGDPSENWEHTFSILHKLKTINKEIVIITKHWSIIPNNLLQQLKDYNICINTSVSALDNPEQLQKCLLQYERLKHYCKSFLRIVSCDFNTENETGKRFSEIQHNLFKNEQTIDTVFRPSKNNQLILDGIINVKKGRFMNSLSLISKFNPKTYIGNCQNCKEKCGIFNDRLRRTPYFEQTKLAL